MSNCKYIEKDDQGAMLVFIDAMKLNNQQGMTKIQKLSRIYELIKNQTYE